MATAYVIFGDGTRVSADVADSEDTRARGLMFQAALAEDRGMLFVFERPGRYAFWMKNVRMPLDIIWLDASRRIVWMVEDAPPCAGEPCPMYGPPRATSFVIELAAGFARRHGVALGDAVTISLPRASSSRTARPDRC